MRQIALADSSLAQISRAVRWITEHHAEPFLVDEFNREYRRYFGLPPGRDAVRLRAATAVPA